MTSFKPLLTALSVVFLSFAAAHSQADDKTHLEEVQTLFKLTQMEKKVNDSVDSIMQMQLSQSPGLEQHEAKMRAFFEKQIGWEALKDDITQMYLRTFTEEELKAINAFYITPAGQKVINALPGLVQERNQLAMLRLQQNIDELRQIVEQPAEPVKQ